MASVTVTKQAAPAAVAPQPAPQAPVQIHQPNVSLIVDVREKSICEAYILGLPLGWLGAHQFYLGRHGWGVLYMFTLGLLGVGWAVDLLRMPCLVTSLNKERRERAKNIPPPPLKKRVDDAYIAAVPFGLLGFHHYYLGRIGWGCLYMFTLGVFGVGWLFDMFRMPCLVASANKEIRAKYERERMVTGSQANRNRVTVTVYQSTTGAQMPPAPVYPTAAPYPTPNPAAAYPPPYNEANYGAPLSTEIPPPGYDNAVFSHTTENSVDVDAKEKGAIP
ncbi:uncharacterized protein [Ptychodera flava]|uniref:uncharacterized protein n=1 Tax=Ptychodera flava TaxID=63121 RepID=UPI00396A8316